MNVMDFFVVLTLFFGASSTGSHTLQYHTVVSSQNATTTGQLDGETFVSYSSSDAEVIPKTEWIKQIDDDVPDYWKSEKSCMSGDHLDLQDHLSRVEELLHQTKGAHTLTRTYTCEIIDDNTTIGLLQILYDGEDFIRLNLSSGTWTAANHQAEQFLEAWEHAGDEAKHWTHYLNYTCIKSLKQYLTYSNNVNQAGGGADGGADGGAGGGAGGGAQEGAHNIIYIIAPFLFLFFVVAPIVSYMKRERLQEFFNKILKHSSFFKCLTSCIRRRDFEPVPV